MKKFDPAQVTISTPSKSFAYEQISRDIEECKDIDLLKDALRCYIKLYFKQQETLSSIPVPVIDDIPPHNYEI